MRKQLGLEKLGQAAINGRLVVDKFIAEVPAYLKPHGRVLLMQSTLTGVEETLQMLTKQNLKTSVIAEQQLPFFETLTLIEAKTPHLKETYKGING